MTQPEVDRSEYVPMATYVAAVRGRAAMRLSYMQTLQELREVCDAAQAVLDGKARNVDSAGDRYVIDQTLQALERAVKKARGQ